VERDYHLMKRKDGRTKIMEEDYKEGHEHGWNEALDFAIKEISDYNFIGYEDLQDDLIITLENKKV